MLKVDAKKALKIANWWRDKYPLMACEEFGELMQVLSKVERSEPERKSRYTHNYTIQDEELRKNLVEELADVAIAVGVLAYRYDISQDELNRQIRAKMYRRYE